MKILATQNASLPINVDLCFLISSQQDYYGCKIRVKNANNESRAY